MASNRFGAALFDVDGTLLDSTDFVVGAFQHTLASHGVTPPSRQAVAELLGPSLADCYQLVAPQLDPRLLCATHRAWQKERIHLVHPFPHVADTLRELRAAGVRLAAVTARSRISSLGTLENSGLSGLIEFTISAEDVARTKPDPAALHLALARLGLPATTAVMIGDTRADILAGKAAGTATIGVTYGFHGIKLAESQPDYLVHDIRELPAILLCGTTHPHSHAKTR